MKKLNLGKTSRIILIAGVFILVIGGLGYNRFQQAGQQALADEELANAGIRLQQFDNVALEATLVDLQEQLALRKQEVEQSLETLDNSVISADVAEGFYKAAAAKGVTVDLFSSTEISQSVIQGTEVKQTNMSATVSASLADLMDFVISLNNSFTSGYVTEVRFSCEANGYTGASLDSPTIVNLAMIVYTMGASG